MVLAMASLGVAAELAPARAEAQTMSQDARAAQPSRPLESRTTTNRVASAEFDALRAASLAALEDVSPLLANPFTQKHPPVYAGEIRAHLETSVAHPETNRASRTHRMLALAGGEPVRALEQATLYFGYGYRTTAYSEAAPNPALEAQPTVRPATAGTGDRHELLAGYRITSLNNDPEMITVPLLRDGQNRFAETIISRSRDEAIFQALTALVTRYAGMRESQATTISGDQVRGNLNLLNIAARGELVLSNIHVDVQTLGTGEYRVTVNANLYIPSVLDSGN